MFLSSAAVAVVVSRTAVAVVLAAF